MTGTLEGEKGAVEGEEAEIRRGRKTGTLLRSAERCSKGKSTLKDVCRVRGGERRDGALFMGCVEVAEAEGGIQAEL